MKRHIPFLNLAPKSAKDVSRLADSALLSAEAELAGILAVPKREKRTLENTLRPMDRIAIAIRGAGHQASLLSAVHPDVRVRAAADKVTERISKFFPKLYMNRAVYEAVRGVDPSHLDDLARRFRDKELLDFKLSGVDKPPAVRAEVRRLIAKSVKLGQAFDRNIKDDTRSVSLKTDDLDGLPEDYRKARKSNPNGVIKISTQYPDYIPFMKYAKNGTARKKLYLEYNNRGWPKNDKVFTELLKVREREATLLGYRNWADYVTVDKMAKSADTVQKFLERVSRLTAKRAKSDYASLLACKRKQEPDARIVMPWESGYYSNVVTREMIGLDTQELRNYFQFKLVKDGVLATTERLFGLSYRRVKAQTWHPDVETFDVYRGPALIGRFHLDLHPREGKYGHAACFETGLGMRGGRLPEATLVCNFSRGLMDHGEVDTFFHEFGHLIHFILAGNQTWARFGGFATEFDFVEAPSQMLEYWAFDLDTLRRFALNVKTGEAITKKLVLKLRMAGDSGKGMYERTQVFYSFLSLRYHTDRIHSKADLLKIQKREQKRYSVFSYVPGTHFYASFGHLEGYSAIYYTYLWSRALAQDILSPFKRRGMYDAKTARRYRDLVLTPGGSKDARQLMRDFLGREWNLKEFKKWLEN